VIVAIWVIAYLIAGIATAVLVILNHGEPLDEVQWLLVFIVLFWPVVLAVELPIGIARRIKVRQAARREKPKVFSDYDEENR
jgi:ABC-type multidrug transport system permease subunit